jgi:hypothetical protein
VLSTDRAAGGVLALIGAAGLRESLQFPLGTLWRPGPAYMPVVLSLLLVGFGVLLAIFSGRGLALRDLRWGEGRHAVAIFGTCAFIALALEHLGYRLTIAAALLFLLGVLERRGPVQTLVLTIAIAAGSFFLFDTTLRVPLPRGPFGL